MAKLLLDGIEYQQFEADKLNVVTTKSLYLQFLDALPNSTVQSKYSEYNWDTIWERLDSAVLQPKARNILFFLIHERLFTRELGHRFIPAVITNPLCIRCEQNTVESTVHLMCECMKIIEPWNSIRDILETIDISLVFETDQSLINLNYNTASTSNSILWIIGEYLVFIDEEKVCSGKSSSSLLNYLRCRWLECSKLAMPSIGFIPGLFSVGVG